MREPPAISIESRPGPAWRATHATLHAAAGTALMAWSAGWLGFGPVATSSFALIAAAGGGWLGWRGSSATSRRLAWSGAQWTLAEPGRDPLPVTAPRVTLDLGAWTLLRVAPATGGRPIWLPVARGADGAAWHLFRAAVYSRATDSAPRSLDGRPPF